MCVSLIGHGCLHLRDSTGWLRRLFINKTAPYVVLKASSNVILNYMCELSYTFMAHICHSFAISSVRDTCQLFYQLYYFYVDVYCPH